MDQEQQTQVTELLGRIREGDSSADGHLFDIVYDELRSMASAIFAAQNARNTLQPTAVVHEAWLKMVGHFDSLESRRHFMAVAAKAMRQVLADKARSAMRQKRGGGVHPVQLNEAVVADPNESTDKAIDLVALDMALTRLSEMHERHAQVVVLRMLGSMTMQEIADELGIPKRTAEEDWTFARIWLRRQLKSLE